MRRHPSEPHDRAIVLYDDACRLCRGFAVGLKRMDRHRRFELVGFSEARRRGLDRGIPGHEFEESFHLLHGTKRWSGADAVPRVLEGLPGGRFAVAVFRRVPGSQRMIRTLYDFVARNRNRWGCRGCADPAPAQPRAH